MSLYPGGTILPREDYDIILEYAHGKESALEFGPGASTLALVEAGVLEIHSYEYQMPYLSAAQSRFAPYPHVKIRRFDNVAEIDIPADEYDIAVVDSPIAGKKWVQIPGQEGLARFNTVMAALKYSPLVLLHDANRPGERRTLAEIQKRGFHVEHIQTMRGMAIIRRA